MASTNNSFSRCVSLMDEEEINEMLESRRTRSLNAPSPVQTFGPCGRIMKNSSMVI
ncbi:unnamed protein product [Callosobruchus maculatus]|uniref:Uncharacterized protein n=1 Tax=Callosobruchus maculatus TaxID=64391 RepID=A0A653DSA8_CALMS|nr:unnamed protein product [Callosobruchus maculatus]